MYGHVGFFDMLTFPVKNGDGENGFQGVEILHLALAKKGRKEYTYPGNRRCDELDFRRSIATKLFSVEDFSEPWQGEPLTVKKKVLPAAVVLALLVCAALYFLVIRPGGAKGFPKGDWAYSSKPEESVIRLTGNGKATYKGTEYSCKDDGTFLILTGGDSGEIRLRYRVVDKTTYLYVTSEYSRKEGTAGEGIIGVWDMDGSEKSFFEFTANGRFLEDGVFDGTYEADYANGSFTLVYPMYFNDTVCYFRQDGEHMTLEYPWSLEETKPAA